jgi:UDP-glucose 6-dehydrogenase
MKIAMIGTGYVGLVSGVCFSDFGHDVVCVDKDPKKIEMLERGEVPIYEPGLDALMAKNVEAGRLSTWKRDGFRSLLIWPVRLRVPKPSSSPLEPRRGAGMGMRI